MGALLRKLSGVLVLCAGFACGTSTPETAPKPKVVGKKDASAPRDAGRDDNPVSSIPPEISAHASDWPLPNHDYDNTRASFDSRLDSTNVDSLRERFRVAFAAATGEPFGTLTAAPLILGDTIYLQDMASNVYALSTDDGSEHWRAKFDLPTVGPNGVAIGWGKAFADLGDLGLVALDLADGAELWRFEPRLSGSEGVDIQPVAYGGMVFMSTVPASLRGAYLGRGRGVIFALEEQRGQVAWLFDTVDSKDLWGDASTNCGGGAWYPPLVDMKRERVYFGTGNPGPFPGTSTAPSGSSRPGPNLYTSSVVALGRAGGELAWFHQERAHDLFDWDFQNAPLRVDIAIDGVMRELVIGSGKTGTVVALDAEDGSLVWRAKVGRHENDALDAIGDGEMVRVFPGALGGVLTAPAYADGVIYVPVVDMATTYSGSSYAPELTAAVGELVALDARDGSERWHHDLPAANYGAATVVNDLVLTSDADGHVYAFARDSGDQLFSYDAGAGINAPLTVAGDLVLVPVGFTDKPVLIALTL